jgi:MFS family permease
MTVLAGRHRARVLSWTLAGVAALVLAAALILLGLNASRVGPGRIGLYGILAVAVGLYSGAGRLIASRLPGNAIGWLLGLIGLSLAATMLSEQYALHGVAVAPGSFPAARLAGWFSGALTLLTVVQLSFLVLLFPDGRLPSRRWRPVSWAMFVVIAGALAAQLQAGTTVSGGFTNALDAAGASYPNPLGIFPRHGWFSALIAAFFVLAVITWVLSVASVFVRRRGASAERRKQLAWLGYVGVMTAVWAAVLLVAGLLTNGANNWIGTLIWGFLVLTPVVGIPLACVVAVLKYRLYEIDRLISRTVAYAIVTGLLVGVYAGLVLLATAVLPRHGSIAVAGSTLAAAALFTPLRSRVQHVVDRRFNRTRYDAELMITAFAARLQDATDLDAVRTDLTSTVHQALEPAHLSLWLGRKSGE